ncbi:MAG: V-type ATP synthase subunit E [Clostridia bacterium]|nr:V-type ATP synthase subunit E [Clostridia bacterium]
MTGLDKILKQIEDEAAENAASVVNVAKKRAEEIISAANAEAQKKAKEILDKAELDAEDIISRGKSSTFLEIKRLTLLKKQAVIKEIIAEAEKFLSAMPDEEYFGIMLKMIRRFAQNKDGEIAFSERDKKRMPKKFADKIAEVLPSKNIKLKIAERCAACDGGFVLIYGGIEENCTFRALFESAEEQLQDKVSSLLFEKG